MPEDTISRRSALRTGGLAALAAGLLGTAGTAPVTAEPAPTIDHAVALLAEVERISLYHRGERDQNNVSQECERLSRILGLADPIAAAAEWPRKTGDNRVMDRIDREEANAA